ncbi:hypothetical protein GLAREA_04833 [Glarea lozoyensis ATCC 20868]|uniref:Uncharacterized protein n=1 Tax=Glarea lozoyensis (strain ATCC 20868 / MF5171) TaxID=1116229 RepID=S3CNG9_GLAL2|nr:uncharacterized protein GLAREA_04833 [Glarea lozoyensis ATCC 20868]EPE28042.1 hypothetical protein GLAREA_04833 [Glarea lozoyensis ATCC 20868]
MPGTSFSHSSTGVVENKGCILRRSCTFCHFAPIRKLVQLPILSICEHQNRGAAN